MVDAESVAGPEWASWYAMSPMERWEASQRLWAECLVLGGTLHPEVDTQSPFWSAEELASFAPPARTGADAGAGRADLRVRER